VLRWFRRTSGTPASDEEIARRLASDPERGWTAFIESHTPTLLALIERAGIVDRDEAMEVYTHVCARLSADGYTALRSRNPAAGSLAGWLAVVVRRAAVDCVRSRIGRRRMFGAVRELDRGHQRVFELYYWDRRPLSEVTEVLRAETGDHVTLDGVLDRLEAIDRVLTDRHRADLLSLLARSRAPVSLDGVSGDQSPAIDPVAETPDPEMALRIRETEARLNDALAGLPPEDAAIVTLKYGEGLTRPQIQRVLRLPELTEHRVRTIVATLRARLTTAGAPSIGVSAPDSRRANG
jgi:DNA-directed RNA polymerase specialized sigma24 family protein